MVVGDVVLIRDEPLVSRLQWPLAKVVKVHPGGDGKIRSVDVKTAKGIVCRPIQRLHRLEVCDLLEVFVSHIDEPVEEMVDDTTQIEPVSNQFNDLSNEDIDNSNEDIDNCRENHLPITITKSGRISRPPDRLCFKRTNFL